MDFNADTTAAAKAADKNFFAFFKGSHKAIAAVMVLIVMGFMPQAHAEQGVVLASAAQVLPQAVSPSGLFGTQEVKSNNISTFKKWTSVLSRFKTEMASGKMAGINKWNMMLAALKDKSRSEKIKGVNDFFNNIAYVEDIDNYKKTDYWATPLEFISRGKGDCEDYAIAKYAALSALGFDTTDLRIAVVHDLIKRVPHAILVVYDAGGQIILDNQNRSLKSAADVNRYKVLFTINEQNWWLHRPVRSA